MTGYFLEQTGNALSLGGIYALLALGLPWSTRSSASSTSPTRADDPDRLCAGRRRRLWLAVPGGAPLAILVVMASAVLLERIAFRPVRGASGATMLLTSFAVAVLLQLAFQLFISTRPQIVPLPAMLTATLDVAGIAIGVNRVISVVVAISVLIALNQFLKRTTIGLAMRAAAEDFDVTRLMGIRANRVIAAAFALSGLLAGIAAILWMAQRSWSIR